MLASLVCVGGGRMLTVMIVAASLVALSLTATEELAVNADDWFYSVGACDGTELQCYTAPPTYRISAAEDFTTYTGSSAGLRASAARNEFESVTLALNSATVDQSCTASLSDFSPELGSESRAHLYQLSYHATENLMDSMTRLLPSSTFDVDASTSSSTILWLRTYVPIDATAGLYTAILTIRCTGNTHNIDIPITLTVFDFTLDVDSHFKTQLNLATDPFQPSFLSNAVDKLDWAKQFLLEYRMTTKSNAWPSGLSYNIAWDCENSVIDDEDYENLPYSAGKNTKRWVLGQDFTLRSWPIDENDLSCSSSTDCPATLKQGSTFASNMLFQFVDNSTPRPSTFCDIPIGDHSGTTAYNAEWQAWIAALDEYLKLAENGGLHDKSYVYVMNEPQDDADAKLANELCHIYKQAAPDLKIAISEEAKPEIAEATDTAGACGYDIWIAHTGLSAYDKEYAWQREESFGEHSWFYSLPQDSGALFSPCENDIGVNDGMNIRVIPWVAFVFRIKGWAYYNFGIFFEGSNPPTPKIGAEIFRDAMEDYEYLWMANNRAHPRVFTNEPVDPVAESVGFSFTAWLRDHAAFAALRHELGRYIEGSRSTLAVLPQDAPTVAEPFYINFQNSSGEPTDDPLIVDGISYVKIGWNDIFDLNKGYGWSGHGIDSDSTPNFDILKYAYRSGGANELENSYIYNDWGREMIFDYAVPNGKWNVTVTVGYPDQARSDQQDVAVNGQVFNDKAVTNVEYFTGEVDVTTGYLTISFGKTFDTYCFISHFWAVPQPATSTPTPSSDDVSGDAHSSFLSVHVATIIYLFGAGFVW